MHDQCPQCGHKLGATEHGSHGHAPTEAGGIVPDIGIGSGSADSSGSQPWKERQRSRSLVPKIAAGVAAVIVGAVALTTVFGGDSTDQADDIPVADPAGADNSQSTDQAVGGADSDTESLQGGGDPNFPPSDEHLAADAIAQVFQTRIDGDDSYAVAYNSQRGLQILSARGASTPDVEVAVGFNQAARYPLMSDGRRTWAINSLTPDLAYLVSTQFVVVDVGLEGSVAFINNSLDPINVGISSFGAWGPGFNVPKDAEILPVPGRGILIVPATGGTFRLTQSGVVKISDDRVVAAGLNSEVFQRCDDELNCELYVTNQTDDSEIVLDVSSTAQVFVSPQGRHVLSTEGDAAVVIDLAANEQWSVGLGAPATGAGWSPDGEFVTILAGEEMTFAFIDQTQVSMTLPILPAGNALLVLDS